jgi:hypothetical protein
VVKGEGMDIGRTGRYERRSEKVGLGSSRIAAGHHNRIVGVI